MAETVRKNLGMVTAYAYAVSKGYTGTEEEFAELMASYADVAQDAEASAQAAAQSATTAEQKATQAAGSATNAAVSATSASESAQAAAGSLNSASLYAQNASASATNAAGSASSASTYAGNASASAQAAEGSADAAQASATQAAGSADDAEAAKDVILGMNAVANTLPAGSQATASYSNGTLTLGIPKGDTGEKGDPGDTNDAPLIYSSASGSIASFADGADDLPMKSCVVSIEPIQAGEGDPSPENVRPISGRTGLSVVRAGKNLLYGPLSSGNQRGLDIIANNTKIKIVGSYNSDTDSTFSLCELTLKPGTYKLIGMPPNSLDTYGLRLQVYNVDRNFTIGYDTGTGFTFTLIKSTTIRLRVYVRASVATGLPVDIEANVMLSFFDNPYEPYKGNTYSVNWETETGTVYGGLLDVVSGELTVTHKRVVLNGSEAWQISGSNNSYCIFGLEPYGKGIDNSAISDRLPTSSEAITTTNQAEGIYTLNSNAYNRFNIYVRWYDANVTTVSEFKTWLAENPLTVTYKLTEPIAEYQLTPQEVRTLLGENNIWSDAGNMAVEYPADTKMYIDQKITEAIAAAMA